MTEKFVVPPLGGLSRDKSSAMRVLRISELRGCPGAFEISGHETWQSFWSAAFTLCPDADFQDIQGENPQSLRITVFWIC